MFAGIFDSDPFYLKAWTYLALLGMLLILFGIIMAGGAQADRNERLRKKSRT